MNTLLFLPLGLPSSRLSVCGNDIHDLIARYQDASDYGLILNCGRQAVTAICLCSHIFLTFRLIEIKILIRTISQYMEINRGIKLFCLLYSNQTPNFVNKHQLVLLDFYFLISIYWLYISKLSMLHVCWDLLHVFWYLVVDIHMFKFNRGFWWIDFLN